VGLGELIFIVCWFALTCVCVIVAWNWDYMPYGEDWEFAWKRQHKVEVDDRALKALERIYDYFNE
jgi:hypothetical protein